MKLLFKSIFNTDGDFSFYEDKVSSLFKKDSAFYEKATSIDYKYQHDGEKVELYLLIVGDPDTCRWACRDLLEALMCSIRTCVHYIVKDVYEVLEYFHENLWDTSITSIEKVMTGNYSGSMLTLTIEYEKDENLSHVVLNKK